MRMPGESDTGATGAPGGSEQKHAGGDFAALAPELTKRIGSILGAVQHEADKMLDDARLEAQRHVDYGKRQADGLLADRQRRLAELSDQLIERTESVVAQLEQTELVRASFGKLLEALSEAADRVAAEVAATQGQAEFAPPPERDPYAPPEAAAPSAAQQAPAPPPVFPRAISDPPAVAPDNPFQAGVAAVAQPEPPPRPAVDRAWVEARQASIQMAAAGNTRAQVEAHVRGFLHALEARLSSRAEARGRGSPSHRRRL
jgi:ElaB/YqjD/DUF883 family membrane-anchored ribosome-binding protein